MARITSRFIDFSTTGDGVNATKIPASYTPINYVPTEVGTEGSDKVSAHLKGMDVTFAAAATPGFTFGRSGTITNGTYLLNDTVPSNVAGRIALVPGKIEEVYFVAEQSGTYVFEIMKRTGNSFAAILTMTVSAKRADVQTFSNIAVAYKDELACRIISGQPKNPVVGVMLRRSTV